jgi:hypothetical protein
MIFLSFRRIRSADSQSRLAPIDTDDSPGEEVRLGGRQKDNSRCDIISLDDFDVELGKSEGDTITPST